jgi:hypoxanthine phosphoribosyltransferase
VDRIYFTWNAFDRAVDILVDKLRAQAVLRRVRSIYGIPRGGLVLAVALSHRLELPLTSEVARRTLVVDDISDTGRTLHRLNGEALLTATIHCVSDTVFVPDVWVLEKPKNTWIVYPWERNNG